MDQVPAMTATDRSPGRPLAMSATGRRVVAGIVALVCGTVLGIAAWLDPSPAGLGTHTALGMRECGWILTADCPCPTCGMTTAFTHAAHGDLVSSFVAQPFGALLSILTAMALVVSTYVLCTGSRVGIMIVDLWSRRVGWTLAFALLAAWVYKIASYKGMIG
ncbi:MAG: DUF2752 domain-containing protein [Phycisphaerales bacterium]|nr:DUF2752 domain-containing protein [Phycisphaerales bacterium]